MVFNCSVCGKVFKTSINFDKHNVLCDFKQKSLKQQELELQFEKELPNQQTMYKLLLDLGVKYNKLEDKYDDINKFVSNKKRKIDVVQWLNSNVKPNITFTRLIDAIVITPADIDLLFQDSVNDSFTRILGRVELTAIYAFTDKANLLYVYDNDVWSEMKREQLVNFLNMIQFKMSKVLFEMKRTNKTEILNNDAVATRFDKTTNKLMGIDFDNVALFNKIRNMIYNKQKTDIQFAIEL